MDAVAGVGLSASFVHLNVRSSYSPRYGVAAPDGLVDRAASYGMDMLALTDRDGLYGAVKHARACMRAGIAPIFGVNLAVEAGGRVTFLAKTAAGWASLCRLVGRTHAAGERGRPVTTPEVVAAHGDGLVALLGPGSDVGSAGLGSAGEVLARWRAACEVAVEIVDHSGRGDAPLARRMLRIAAAHGVPAVLTNAVRYLDPADAPVAQVLDASRKLVPLDRRHVEDRTGRAHFRSGADMLDVAERICGPDRDAVRALFAATRGLAERCALDPGSRLGLDDLHLPEVAAGMAEVSARCSDGLVRRGLALNRGALERLDQELAVIRRTGLAAYFVVVSEIAALIRERGIRCAIRGSGAGCLVNYLLGIGDVNPLEHGLLMERFLYDATPLGGPRRLPDIDLDVESARRLEVYRAIFDKYGEDRVACVSMMETYKARGAIRDVGAAVGLPPHEIDAIAKAFPHVRAREISSACAELPELRRSGLGAARLSAIFRLAERLDGLPRHIALHPCGVIVSDAFLRDRTPVERSLLGFPMSQFDKDDVEEMGLLKLDVLGVRMQSAMAYAHAEIDRTEGRRIDLATIPRDDEPTFELIRAARTLGCFQVESPGQRELVVKLAPRTFDDLIIDISLFRPGPVGSDMIGPFLDVRHGRRPPCHPHPDLAGVLGESGGVVVFHEQVLRVIDTMTGCGLPVAEVARRRLGSERLVPFVEQWFREAAFRTGYDPATIDRVWATLAAFGAFGFCKAHATSFALPTYQSAWLKRHHPAAFFAGVLTHEPGMYPKRAILDDARRFGVEVLPLDVNASDASWRVEGPGPRIRVALSEVKGISDDETARIVAGRPYTSLGDFWYRSGAARPIVERIVLVGGLRSVDPRPRRDLLCQVRMLFAHGRGAGGQLPLGLGATAPPAGELPEMTDAEIVAAELEILGMDVSAHALSFYAEFLAELGTVRAADLPSCPAGAVVLVAGVKIVTETPAIRSGRRIIFATVEDGTGLVDATFFESVRDRCAATMFGSSLLVIRGRIRKAEGRAVSLNATDCWDLPRLRATWTSGGIRGDMSA